MNSIKTNFDKITEVIKDIMKGYDEYLDNDEKCSAITSRYSSNSYY